MTPDLKAPFPYFGGKSKIAPAVWERFGHIDNYVEPFFGSGAVLLSCPWPGHTETVNDADGLLCNFWRALQADPDAVAQHADYPVMELDLHSRHRWLVARRAEVERLLADPDYYDAKAAGWWVWGISQWIGGGWCTVTPSRASGLRQDGTTQERRPRLGGGGRSGGQNGIFRTGLGLPWKRPHMGGVNTNADGSPGKGSGGKGVHRQSFGKLPSVGATGPAENTTGKGTGEKGVFKVSNLAAYLRALADRLRRVRVTCGDFARVLTPSVTWRHGTTAVFLDPPYDRTTRADVYAVESDAAHRARAWAIENGDNPLLRIAYCGYDDGHEWPDGWVAYRWKAAGGYGSQGNGRGRENAGREVVWFSPHCVTETPLEAWAREQEAA